MQSLATENLFSLALELPVEDISSLCFTNKAWAALCSDQYLWKLLVERDFGVDVLPIQYVEDNDWKSYYKNLERFYSSFIYLVLVSDYSGQSQGDIEKEYARLEQNHAYFVEETHQPFVLVPSKVDYQISDDEITFYLSIKPTQPGLTILDLQKLVDDWEGILEEENALGDSSFINYGYSAGYKIVRPRK